MHQLRQSVPLTKVVRWSIVLPLHSLLSVKLGHPPEAGEIMQKSISICGASGRGAEEDDSSAFRCQGLSLEAPAANPQLAKH